MEWLTLLFQLDELTGFYKLYALSVWLGILLPAVSVLFSGFTDSIELDFDLPINPFLSLKPSCIMLFLLLFGTSGLFFIDTLSSPATFLISFLIGYGAAGLLYAFLLEPMKKSSIRCSAANAKDYIGMEGCVSVRIKPETMGAVNIGTKAGLVSFVARLEEGSDSILDEGEIVEILAINSEHTILTVRKKHFM